MVILPRIFTTDFMEALHIERHTASKRLRKLVEIGVLSERVVGREKLFLHGKFMRLLTQDSNDLTPYLPLG